MKLLVNAAFVGGKLRGINRYLQRLVPPLSRLCKVTVLASDHRLFAGTHCDLVSIPEWTQTLSRRFLWEITCLRQYCTEEYDVLLCPTPIAPPGIRLPVISIVHDLTPLVMSHMHSAEYKTMFWLGLQTLRWADAVVAVSDHTKSDLGRLRIVPPRRVYRVLEGPGLLPTEEENLFAQRFYPYILYVGGHWSHKNVTKLVATFVKLKSKEKLKLVIVGGGPMEVTEKAVRKRGLENRIVLLSDLPDAYLSSLYVHCSAFVFPSLYEGFGLPVLEALAHGAPIACSHTSSIPEVAGKAALYFDPHSVKDMASKVQILLDDSTLVAELRNRGPDQASRFSWEKAASEIYQIAMKLTRHRAC